MNELQRDNHPSLETQLTSKLAEIRLKNPSYSLRAFSMKLGVSAATLSLILAGKRKASAKLVRKIGQRLCLPPDEMEALLAPLRMPEASASRQATAAYVELTLDHFNMISEWYHFAILSLSETEGFSENPEWIGKRLGVAPSKILRALERLERLGMMEKNPEGQLCATGIQYSTPDDMKNVLLQKAHFNNLDLARTSLERDDINERDFTAITLNFDPDDMAEAKAMIRNFQDQFIAHFKSRRKKQVYKLCMQYVPVSRSVT